MTLSDFYTSGPWVEFIQYLRLERLNEDDEIVCEYCGNVINRKYDCIGHHVIELTSENFKDATIALNPDNVQLVHHKCHNIIHSRFGCTKRSVYLVYGSPCAGKSTYVRNIAGREDLILDIDSLWSAICIDGPSKPDRLRANMFALRDTLLDQIKTRNGKWRNAYIIGGYPMQMERDRMYKLYGAEPIFIDTPHDVCSMRAENKPATWKTFVDEWWEKYQPDPQA